MSKRVSPLNMGLQPRRVLHRNGWEIALTYVGEMSRNELFITDLSHVPKFCLQGPGPDLDAMNPAGLNMPQAPGSIEVDRGILLARLLSSEARVMVLKDEAPAFPEANYTDITDGYAAMAVVGPRCFDVLAKLSSVDLEGKATAPAALAPVEDVTCLMVRLGGKGAIPGLILAGARGYGHFLLDAVLDAGKEHGIQPAGHERFTEWLDGAEPRS